MGEKNEGDKEIQTSNYKMNKSEEWSYKIENITNNTVILWYGNRGIYTY